jgi:ABC-type transporter Mla subunit MlaD
VKRLALIALALACAAVVAIVGTGASGDDGGTYEVRAIFDSAFSVITGEDVKIAGVNVGKITELEVTPDNKAAVVLTIDKPGFQDFRADATCRIRPQSLIGEKFVECAPTQPRAPGDPVPPPLREIPEGQEGAGQRLLPVANTERTVDLDLVNNTLRLPYRQRLAIIVNELGTGLAGNGRALNEAIRRADPALQETDRVLQILADQNRVLADLARDGDAVLQPLADRREQVADFVVKANRVAQATAARRTDLERSLQRLPRFLDELRPTMRRLGAFADEASPVVEDLAAEAPSLTRFARALGPFSRAGIPAVRTLGEAAEVGTEAVPATLPFTRELRATAREARPLAANLKATLESFRDTGGIERLMDYIFFQVAAINGFDSVGHYLRAGLIVNTCTTYATAPNPACLAKFQPAGDDDAEAATARAAASASTGDVYLDRMNRILARIANGEDPDAAAKAVLERAADDDGERAQKRTAKDAGEGGKASARTAPLRLPQDMLPAPAPPAEPAPQATGGERQSGGGAPDTGDPADTLLDYLLGGPA